MRNDCGHPAAGFPSTRWTRVVAARGASEEAGEALRELCADYYAPVVAFLVREGRTPDAAREVAHGFFEELLAGGGIVGVERDRGRFRSYLLGALRHHLGRQRARDGRLKRGGGIVHVPLGGGDRGADSEWRGPDVPDAGGLTPEEAYDRQWALIVVARALEAVGGEWARRGAGEEFERLRPWLTGEASHGDQRAVAEALARSTSAVKVAIWRLRRTFRERVREEVGRTLDDPRVVDEEMRALLDALG